MSGISPRPAIFSDKGFLKAKKYHLSTSNVSNGAGGFMAATEEGYGVCYGIFEGLIVVNISSYAVGCGVQGKEIEIGKYFTETLPLLLPLPLPLLMTSCWSLRVLWCACAFCWSQLHPATSAARYKKALEDALMDMQRMVLENSAAGVGMSKL